MSTNILDLDNLAPPAEVTSHTKCQIKSANYVSESIAGQKKIINHIFSLPLFLSHYIKRVGRKTHRAFSLSLSPNTNLTS